MPIAFKYGLVCDDVRREDNGKFLIIGMYTPDISVSQIPFVIPTLAFFMWLESDRPGNFPFTIRLEQLETGKVLAQGMGMVGFARPGIGPSIIRMGGVQFASPGAYTFSMQFEGQTDRVVLPFAVVLNVSPPSGQKQQE